MKNRFVQFQAPYQVNTMPSDLIEPGEGELLVQVKFSAISPGTEMLVYRGLLPQDMPQDTSISALQESFHYPISYGYACVGQIIRAGDKNWQDWVGKRVFAFQPHQMFFVSAPEMLIPIPDDVAWEDALFFANLETALNLVQDTHPVFGERGVVFGLGVVGMLTAMLLNQFPLSVLTLVEPKPFRQELAQKMGLRQVNTPVEGTASLPFLENHQNLQDNDFAVEVSGSSQALQQAIQAVGFDGRVIVGSWFGTKPVTLDLGSHFHRQRIRLISSQVSTISPVLKNRWDKARRAAVVWQQLQRLKPSRLITHRFTVEEAQLAYQLIDQQADSCLQVILTY